MKISPVVCALLVASASAMRVSPMEANDLLECSHRALTELDNGNDGNKASCNMLYCLQQYGTKYNRGGVFAKLSYILDVVCVGNSIIGGFLH
ncbi:hypothetical protein FQN49_003253 [Arthroderma sp. PD_2]|nr:hypothetical protein FQN49_003253 [Arthroderma sp. PD_2]